MVWSDFIDLEKNVDIFVFFLFIVRVVFVYLLKTFYQPVSLYNFYQPYPLHKCSFIVILKYFNRVQLNENYIAV